MSADQVLGYALEAGFVTRRVMSQDLLARLERLESLPENRHSVCLRSGRTD